MIIYPLKHCIVFVAFFVVDFLTFLRRCLHQLYTRVILNLLFSHLSEHCMLKQVLHMPIMQLLHISYTIQPTFRLQQVGIFTTEPCVYYSSSKVLSFEVGISETDEDFEQSSPSEVLRQMPHTVGSDNCNVVVISRLFYPHSSDLLSDVVCQLITNLQTENQIGGEGFTQGKQQTTESTPYINNFNLFLVPRISLVVVRGMFYSVAYCCVVLLLGASKEHRVMGFPIHIVWVYGVGERS